MFKRGRSETDKNYKDTKLQPKLHRELIEAAVGISLSPDNGMLVSQHPESMTSEHFYRASEGSYLELLDTDFQFAIATYSKVRDEQYLYTYSYQDEENWTTYRQDFKGNDSYRQKKYVFEEDVYFRITLLKEDGSHFLPEDAGNISSIIIFYRAESGQESDRSFFQTEVNRTAASIYRKTTKKSLVFALLSDSHYTVNGTWEDTAANIKAVHRQVGFDGIVHLGDITDGMVSKKICRDYTNRVISDLKDNHVPLYLCIGNHDTNYFKGNSEFMSYGEQYALYLRHLDKIVVLENQQLYYYVDYSHVRLRCLFLYSFDHREKVRYGFDAKQVEWVKDTLENTPDGYKVIVFSHDAPLARLDYWADEIRNGEELVNILEEYHQREGHCVIAYIHGHTHADYIYRERSFPIVSVGCSKCEYFPDKKPEGSIRYKRQPDTVSQDLWDTMIIQTEENRIEFIRFGAGEDRSVKNRG